MRQRGKKVGRIDKGAPSGFIISLIIHAAAFMLAGMLVVFNVVKKEEKKFVPPTPVERPKMKLKKPKVKVKKTAKPKSTQRIVTKVQKASMPDIQLPEMSGIGDGLVGDIGGFDIMPNVEEITLFGGGQTIGSDFVGTFYDFKRNRNGGKTIMDEYQFVDAVARFISSGWKTSKLARFYRSPKKLYATSFMVPTTPSYVAPASFGESETIGYCWMAHYKGELVYPEDITFRFVGQGDDMLVVRVGGEIVLNASWPDSRWDIQASLTPMWQSRAPRNRQSMLGNNWAEVGDWITLKAGEAVPMEVLFGEVPGGAFDGMLLVEVKDVEYELNSQGGPVLPMFTTAKPTRELLDVIYEWLVPGEAVLTNGPVFSDFGSTGSEAPKKAAVVEPEPQPEIEEPVSVMRTWNLASGKSLEAEFVCTMGDKVVLKSPKGKQFKVERKLISAEDKEFVELEDVPEFNLEFSKQEKTFMNRYPLSPQELDWNRSPPRVIDYTFGIKVRNDTANSYEHELRAEYHVFGAQRLDDRKYKLLQRGETTFNLTEENDRSYEFKSENPVELITFDLRGQMRGIAYYGYVLTLTDKRGKVIQYAASSDWLYEQLDKIRNLPVGAFINRKGERVYPTGPTRQY